MFSRLFWGASEKTAGADEGGGGGGTKTRDDKKDDSGGGGWCGSDDNDDDSDDEERDKVPKDAAIQPEHNPERRLAYYGRVVNACVVTYFGCLLCFGFVYLIAMLMSAQFMATDSLRAIAIWYTTKPTDPATGG